ncbi:apolipoprotein F [Bubalus bubalis]|uniref:apolipoprotein F n=1 Tax=Bubalus bubalis TaxID=89462 RepID=UPI001E1B9AE9|nr:apolipoprotein F [Bubalus bubalis]XP_006075071.3 apolipoprotein F [Bubalus bubalis]
MMQAVLLLCCVLMSPVAAFPRNAQEGALTFQPSISETGHPLSLLSNQILLPDPKTCQDLLHVAPSLAPLPEYLSNLALEVVLEEIGCTTEAHILQLQLVKIGGKDTTETLIRESKKHNEGEGIGQVKVILKDLGGSPGELRRAQRSVTLPEACRQEDRWVLYETAKMIAEFAEKLPNTELVKEFKAAAIDVTQKCTDESWEHLQAVSNQLVNSPEMKDLTMPMQDQLYFIKRSMTILMHIVVGFIKTEVQNIFG